MGEKSIKTNKTEESKSFADTDIQKREREIYLLLSNSREKGKGKLLPTQLKTMKEFDDYYKTKPSKRGGLIKASTRLNMLNDLRSLGLFLIKHKKQTFKPKTQKEIPQYTELIVRFANSLKSDSSRSTYKVNIRTFYKYMYGVRKTHEFPTIVDDERLVPERPVNKKKRSDLLTSEEVQKMLGACLDEQDEALLMTCKEMGGRSGEIVSANIESVEFDASGCKFYTETSKSQQRYVRLVEATPYLKTWINKHPEKQNPKAPLFLGKSMYYGKRLLPNGVNLRVQRIAKRAGIVKRVHSHMFRTMAITELASKGFSLQMNAKRHGITPSTLDAVYSKLVDRDIDDAYLTHKKAKSDLDKVQEQEEEERFKPRLCPECGYINTSKNDYCQNVLTGLNNTKRLCGAPLTLEVSLKQDKKLQDQIKDLQKQMLEMNVANVALAALAHGPLKEQLAKMGVKQ